MNQTAVLIILFKIYINTNSKGLGKKYKIQIKERVFEVKIVTNWVCLKNQINYVIIKFPFFLFPKCPILFIKPFRIKINSSSVAISMYPCDLTNFLFCRHDK